MKIKSYLFSVFMGLLIFMSVSFGFVGCVPIDELITTTTISNVVNPNLMGSWDTSDDHRIIITNTNVKVITKVTGAVQIFNIISGDGEKIEIADGGGLPPNITWYYTLSNNNNDLIVTADSVTAFKATRTISKIESFILKTSLNSWMTNGSNINGVIDQTTKKINIVIFDNINFEAEDIVASISYKGDSIDPPLTTNTKIGDTDPIIFSGASKTFTIDVDGVLTSYTVNISLHPSAIPTTTTTTTINASQVNPDFFGSWDTTDGIDRIIITPTEVKIITKATNSTRTFTIIGGSTATEIKTLDPSGEHPNLTFVCTLTNSNNNLHIVAHDLYDNNATRVVAKITAFSFKKSLNSWITSGSDIIGDIDQTNREITLTIYNDISFNTIGIVSSLTYTGDSIDPSLTTSAKSGETSSLTFTGATKDFTINIDGVYTTYKVNIKKDISPICVSTTGLDTNAGDESNPLKTVTKALTKVTGDKNRILLVSGTYEELINISIVNPVIIKGGYNSSFTVQDVNSKSILKAPLAENITVNQIGRVTAAATSNVTLDNLSIMGAIATVSGNKYAYGVFTKGNLTLDKCEVMALYDHTLVKETYTICGASATKTLTISNSSIYGAGNGVNTVTVTNAYGIRTMGGTTNISGSNIYGATKANVVTAIGIWHHSGTLSIFGAVSNIYGAVNSSAVSGTNLLTTVPEGSIGILNDVIINTIASANIYGISSSANATTVNGNAIGLYNRGTQVTFSSGNIYGTNTTLLGNVYGIYSYSGTTTVTGSNSYVYGAKSAFVSGQTHGVRVEKGLFEVLSGAKVYGASGATVQGVCGININSGSTAITNGTVYGASTTTAKGFVYGIQDQYQKGTISVKSSSSIYGSFSSTTSGVDVYGINSYSAGTGTGKVTIENSTVYGILNNTSGANYVYGLSGTPELYVGGSTIIGCSSSTNITIANDVVGIHNYKALTFNGNDNTIIAAKGNMTVNGNAKGVYNGANVTSYLANIYGATDGAIVKVGAYGIFSVGTFGNVYGPNLTTNVTGIADNAKATTAYGVYVRGGKFSANPYFNIYGAKGGTNTTAPTAYGLYLENASGTSANLTGTYRIYGEYGIGSINIPTAKGYFKGTAATINSISDIYNRG